MKGKRPAIPEDTVFFSLFTCEGNGNGNEEELQKKLHSLRTDCLALALSLSQAYIWQHEAFDLSLHSNSSCPCAFPPQVLADAQAEGEPSVMAPSSLPPHLHGKLRYGDNIEDEWYVVFILFAISRQFPELCIRVWDTDGEFLLIEAAYSIPRWLKPENSWNRVFIRNGEVHILPLPSSPAELVQVPVLPSLEDALRIFHSANFRTRADDSVQAAISHRLSGFQQNPNYGMHNVVCRVPLPVAQILKHEPQLVALAVGAFYDRDLDSMKAASQMSHFLPSNKEVQMVDVMVRMSRAMYAQLTQQVFQAPRCYPMPHLSDPHYHEAEIGMKLTCGFEMMYWERADCDAQGNVSTRADTRGSKDVGWQAFLASLQQTGYFKDLLEGSKEYRELMDRAVSRYRQTSLFTTVSAAMNAPIQRITEILALPHLVEDFARSMELKSDDDSWLYNGEDDLKNAMLERQKEIETYELERTMRKTNRKQAKDKRLEDDFGAEEVVRSMHAFMDKMSSYEGAELPRDNAAVEDNSEPVTLRMETFLKELKSAFGPGLEAHHLNKENNSSDEMDTSSSDVDSDDEAVERRALMDEDIPNTSLEEENTFMEDYAEVLSRELTSSSLAKSFVPIEKSATIADKNKETEDMEGLPPVNIDMNLLQNLLESYSSQHGLPGPASNLLGAMGLHLPDDKDKS
eukprot:c23719_g1_i1 orf=225-2279(-)